MARINVNPDRVIGPVHPRVYGSFVEHLGRCVYGGIWEEGSPLSDDQGYRRDVFQAVRELGVTCLRYPGGNFVSNYHWRDGVGPRLSRPARRELAWKAVESNAFGTHEFLEYCARLGCEPYLCVNLGTGTPEEAADWLEYCNSTQPTTITQQRVSNGHAAPYGVRLWGLGNEMYGPWQIGQRPARDYAWIARETAKAMRLVDPRIELVAVGHEDGPNWNATVIAETAPYIDYLALHLYVGSDDTAEALAQPLLLERLARQHAAVIDLVLTDLGLDKRIGLAIDEWNVWYRAVPSRVQAQHDLDAIEDPEQLRALTSLLATEEPYNLRDALAVACLLNALLRCADIVDIANLAQLVNAIAPIHTTPTGLVRHTTYYPFALYRRLMGGVAIGTDVVVDAYDARVGSLNTKEMTLHVPYLDTVATIDPATRTITCAVVNRSPDAAIEVEMTVGGRAIEGAVDVWTLTAESLETGNTADDPERVTPSHRVVDGREFARGSFGPRSMTIVRCPAG